MCYAKVSAAFGALCAAKVFTPSAATMGFAVDGSALGSLLATVFLASPPATMGYAKSGSSSGSLCTPLELTFSCVSFALLSD